MTKPSDRSRRDFVTDSARLALGAMIIPRHVIGATPFRRAPSDTLNFAVVGFGGMGMNNVSELLQAGENLVAVCDIDPAYCERQLAGRLRPNREGVVSQNSIRLNEAYTKAARYTDFREMLERQRDIDAVIIATPDHLHAPVAVAAMRAGKHVYVQKPLTYSVYEARLLARVAAETKVATQMGNQGHSREGTRRINDWIKAGVIGPVREVHIWTDRPQRYWAQGIPGPTQIPGTQPAGGAPSRPQAPTGQPALPPAPPSWNIRTVERAILAAMAENPRTLPDRLKWDLFLGPAAQDLPYHPAYHPFSWRGWVPFGVSAIGDMGAHLIDQAYWSLGLTLPTSVISYSTPWGGPANNPASYPLAMATKYEFAARGSMPPVTMHWYDGGLSPMVLADVPRPGGDGGGAVFVGEKGYLTHQTYGDDPKIFPAALAAEAEAVPKSFPRVETGHEVNWAQACKGEVQASCPFDYAAPLTEVMLLGIVALRAGQNKRIEYDGANMSVTNVPDANQYLTREYRSGWAL
ncbi:MAG TPA: Gfo/Idh/MocA family oxidoreductase [Gemmatimonadaceae bacterium]